MMVAKVAKSSVGTSVNSGNSGSGVDSNRCGVDGMTMLRDNSVESVDGISSVVDYTEGTVGFHQAVLSLH